jgi:hypothetical protein
VRLSARGLKTFVPSSSYLYSKLPLQDGDDDPLLHPAPELVESYELEAKAGRSKRPTRILPFYRIWTKNVLCTLLAQAFFDFQMG